MPGTRGRPTIALAFATTISASCGDQDDPGGDGSDGGQGSSGAPMTGDPTGMATGDPDGVDSSDDGPETGTDTGASVPCGAYVPGLAFDVCSAGYLAGPGDDAATATAIGPYGDVWWAGSIIGSDLGLVPTSLPGAGDGALVRLSSDGRALAGITRFGTRIEDLAIAPDGAAVIGGDAGVAVLEPDGATVRWSQAPGSVVRVATDGVHVVTLVDGQLRRYDGGGAELAVFDAGGGTINDVALVGDLAIVTGFKQDDGPPCTQLQIPFIRAFTGEGERAWTDYDWNKDEVGAADQCADTRGIALSVGGDGLLYYAGESHGGNTVHHRLPGDLAGDAPNVHSDPYDDPYGLNGAAPIAYYARIDPADGRLIAGQFLLTRLSDGKGNAARPKAIAADADGRVFLAGATACCIENGTMRTVNGAPAMSEGYQGGGFVLIVEADFSSRMTWTTLRGESGDGETAVAIALGAGNVAVAFTQHLDEGSTAGAPLLSFDAFAAEPGGGAGDGYLAVFPAP
jgi:hypothetical protein